MLALLLALIPTISLAAPIRLEAPDSVRTLLQRYLDLPETTRDNDAAGADRSLDEAGRLALERRLRQEGGELLATEGYFSPRIDLQTSANALLVEVEPGPRAQIVALNASA